MEGEGGQDLFRQAVVMSTWREAAFVVEYSPEGVAAVGLDDVIAARGKSLGQAARRPFDEFIVDQFIGCKIGDRDLLYDSRRKRLYWRNVGKELVIAPFAVKHSFRINVKPPWYTDATLPQPDRELKLDEIHLNRMLATPSEILGVGAAPTKDELKKARRQLAQLYHPDKAGTMDEQIRAALTRRMAEANAAYDEATGKDRRHKK